MENESVWEKEQTNSVPSQTRVTKEKDKAPQKFNILEEKINSLEPILQLLGDNITKLEDLISEYNKNQRSFIATNKNFQIDDALNTLENDIPKLEIIILEVELDSGIAVSTNYPPSPKKSLERCQKHLMSMMKTKNVNEVQLRRIVGLLSKAIKNVTQFEDRLSKIRYEANSIQKNIMELQSKSRSTVVFTPTNPTTSTRSKTIPQNSIERTPLYSEQQYSSSSSSLTSEPQLVATTEEIERQMKYDRNEIQSIERDVREINHLMQEVSQITQNTQEDIDEFENNINESSKNVDKSVKNLKKAGKYKTGSVVLACGIAGGLVGGPVGLAAGASIAAVAAGVGVGVGIGAVGGVAIKNKMKRDIDAVK